MFFMGFWLILVLHFFMVEGPSHWFPETQIFLIVRDPGVPARLRELLILREAGPDRSVRAVDPSIAHSAARRIQLYTAECAEIA